MALKKYKPTSPARRWMTVTEYKGVLTDVEPHKPLLSAIKKSGGRNASGRITVRH
ncbi:MAG: 50S ribosomal protein L2, partial [Oscillospiraceae bacterium]|nr:50S ribosomal protein L2 [Oscillospiraceae bacterium]